MKRLFTLILVLIVCVTSLTLPTAAEPTDSRYLTPEEKAQLSNPYKEIFLPPEDTIIKLYSIVSFFDFMQGKDIETIIGTKEIIYMGVTSSKAMYSLTIYQGRGNVVEFYRPWEGFYTYTVSPNLVFDSSVKVNKIYCLEGFSDLFGAYIYYNTDHGEYVLFTEYENSPHIYLLSLADFYKYSVAVYYEDKPEPGYYGTTYCLDELCNAKKALFNNTPHAVPHPDNDNNGKCDVCECAIPEDNDPVYHISDITINESTIASDNIDETKVSDKLTDNIEETEESDNKIDEIEETKATNEIINEDKESDVPTDKIEIGCDSSVALPAAVAVGVIGTAFIFKKKKSRTKCKERTVE